MAEKNLSADAKPFIPGGGPSTPVTGPSGGSGGGSGGEGGSASGGAPSGGAPSGPGSMAGSQRGSGAPGVPGTMGGSGIGGPGLGAGGGTPFQPRGMSTGPSGPQGGGGPHGPRSPLNPHPSQMGGSGMADRGGGGDSSGALPNLGGPTNVPMYNRDLPRGGQPQHGGGGGGGGGYSGQQGGHHGGDRGMQGSGRFPMNQGGGGGQGFQQHHTGGPNHPQGPGGNFGHGGHQNNNNGPQGGGGGWNQGGHSQQHQQHRGAGSFGPGGNMGPGGPPGGNHQQHHHGPGPNNYGPGQGQGGHHQGGPMQHQGGPQGGPGGQGGFQNQQQGPQEPPHRPLVVLMLGGICAGKSVVGQKIAELNPGFMYIQNDDELSGYTKLDGLLRQQNAKSGVRGYILDDFIIRCKEEVHYILNLLARCRLSIDSVVYLQTDDMHGCLNRAGLKGAPEAIKMAQHAAHYEATMEYFNHIPKMIVAPEDILNKSVEQIAAEVLVTLKATMAGSKARIEVPTNKLMTFANFIPDYSQFLQVRKQVTEQLGGKWDSYLTQPGGSLDYAKFVRKNHNLRKYRVSANFQGERVMVIKRGKEVYLIPENHYGMFQLDTHLVPTQFQTMDDFIFDAIGVKLRGGPPAEDNRIIFVNDVLFCDGDQDMLPSPAGHPWMSRSMKVKEKLKGLPGNTIFMARPCFTINDIGSQLVNKEWKFPGDGLIFYPPGRYAGGQDPRILTFDFPADALVTVRVWEGASSMMENPSTPPLQQASTQAIPVAAASQYRRGSQPSPTPVQPQPQPQPESGWTFTGLVLDYAGDEVLLDEKVQVISEQAEKYNINDGCLLDFKRVPANGKKASYWKFFKRADHKAKPSLIESACSIAEPDWTKETLTAACQGMKPLTDMPPGMPQPPMSPVL